MRDRLLMPLFVPVGVLAVIGLVLYSFSRILVELGERHLEHYATIIALVVAAGILGVCSLIALAPRLRPTQLYAITAAPAAAIMAIGLFIAVRPHEAAEPAGSGPVTVLTMVAGDNFFQPNTFTVPAGAEITYTLDNKGVALHNFHVTAVKSADGKDIKTELLAGGKQETIKFTVAAPGTYDFLCDVHPADMRGKLTVVEGGAAAPAAGAGGAAGAPAGPNTVIMTDNKFDKTTMTIKANEEVTITAVNRGSAIHNWHVTGVKDKAGKDIMTPLKPGGSTDPITFTIERPGTYDYLCDVHPVEMRGKLTVQ